jgi:hypothetical protein
MPFCFKHFLPTSFFSQAKKNKKTKKTIEKNKNVMKGGLTFKLSFYLLIFCSYLWPPIFAILFQTLFPRHFLLLKPNKKKKKRKEKKYKEGRELTFKLSLCPLTFGSCF